MGEAKRSSNAIRDQDYFLESIFFKIEESSFQVPRLHFERNEVFATLFTLPTVEGTSVEGSSEACPLVIEAVTANDFKALLRILYPPIVPDDYRDIPLASWTSVLHLSTMWEFDALRALAIEKMSARGVLASSQKIILGRRHAVNSWFVEGCVEFVTRASGGPTAAEMLNVGTDVAEKIYKIREARAGAVARFVMFNVLERVEAEFKEVLSEGRR